MNREELIEKAAKADFEHYRAMRPADHGPYQTWEELDVDYREYRRGGIRAALAVFEEAHAPSDDERCCAHVKCPGGSLCCCLDKAGLYGVIDRAIRQSWSDAREHEDAPAKVAEAVEIWMDEQGFHRTVQGEPATEPASELEVDADAPTGVAVQGEPSDAQAAMQQALDTLLSPFPGNKIVPGSKVRPHDHVTASEEARRILQAALRAAAAVEENGKNDG